MLFTPAHQGKFSHRFAIHWSAAVSALLAARSPFAISRLIVAIVIDALNGQTQRAAAHIFKKQLVVVPSFANRYSSASIIMKASVSRILASLDHRAPNVIFAASNVTMFSKADHAVCLETSTAFASSCSHTYSIYNLFISTIASAQNTDLHALSVRTITRRNKPQDGQPPEAFSNHSCRDVRFASHRTPLCPGLEPSERATALAACLL